MRTVQLLERIAALDTRGARVCDAAMVDLLAQLPQHIPALLEVLEKARDASASLENTVLSLGQHMSPADQIARSQVADSLSVALHALGCGR